MRVKFDWEIRGLVVCKLCMRLADLEVLGHTYDMIPRYKKIECTQQGEIEITGIEQAIRSYCTHREEGDVEAASVHVGIWAQYRFARIYIPLLLM